MKNTKDSLARIFCSAFLLILLGPRLIAADFDFDEFKSISPTLDGIKVRFKDNGMRFSFQIGDQERQISNYGETVDIKFGENADFSSKHFSIVFTALQSVPKGFAVEKVIDQRSFGGVLVRNTVILTIQSGTIAFSNP